MPNQVECAGRSRDSIFREYNKKPSQSQATKKLSGAEISFQIKNVKQFILVLDPYVIKKKIANQFELVLPEYVTLYKAELNNDEILEVPDATTTVTRILQ
ncbi:uncharacterized protein OCT59_012812 [Rhizophagus irregularis]|uniref:uncharacterized protein n=1 Tax=Rhizophagus irregularis TaxID=588596 RepID=UPI00332823C1|nr:hypothetical protein OCT59_012812 [Rhizophagus irregularis]